MNKQYETAIKQRETAAAVPKNLKDFDFKVGDVVQMKADGQKIAGRVGEIIGIRYIERKGEGLLSYTIRFSDNESIEANASNFVVVRSAKFCP